MSVHLRVPGWHIPVTWCRKAVDWSDKFADEDEEYATCMACLLARRKASPGIVKDELETRAKVSRRIRQIRRQQKKAAHV